MFFASGVTAFVLRFEIGFSHRVLLQMLWAIAVWASIKTGVFWRLGLHCGTWRYVSIPDLIRICTANATASLIAIPMILELAPDSFPRSVFLIDFLVCTSACCGIRLALRVILDNYRRPITGKRALIYGAGAAAVSVLSEIRKTPRLGYNVVGFVDDDIRLVGVRVQTVRVLGTGRNLQDIVRSCGIEEVLIAIPTASGQQMTNIIQACQAAAVKCRTIPSLAEIMESQALIRQIRDVAVDDLLGRVPVELDTQAISAKIEGRVIMITGAAGSIGSELCRQVARFRPRAIVAYEIAETPLFEIERELRSRFPDVRFFAEVGSIQNRRRLREVMSLYAPSLLYHAAAYKHVPMMEAHLYEAVENNVFGTLNVAEVADEQGVSDFVLISSDKAVRPTNVMGTTKRISELIISSIESCHTKYVSVRFGNVLGSSGSVVPIFKKQIAAGGPVTITHPEMRRYFMTIPEAVQLVLQASTMGHGKEIFVLDMGSPVKVVDLARKLILLSGLRPDEDIRVEYTGIRPGEKLYEELNTVDENTVPTFHEKINIFKGPETSAYELHEHLHLLKQFCESRDACGLLVKLKDLVPEYNPSADILRRILTPNAGTPREPEYTAAASHINNSLALR